jgi:hypothetical protein
VEGFSGGTQRIFDVGARSWFRCLHGKTQTKVCATLAQPVS